MECVECVRVCEVCVECVECVRVCEVCVECVRVCEVCVVPEEVRQAYRTNQRTNQRTNDFNVLSLLPHVKAKKQAKTVGMS